MDASRILMTICTIVLSITLILSILALSSLRNAVDESDAMRQEAAVLVDKLVEHLDDAESNGIETNTPNPNEEPSQNPTEEKFLIRAINDKIGVFTEDGALIHVLDVLLDSMPAKTREDLKKGVSVGSMQELINRLQDYTS